MSIDGFNLVVIEDVLFMVVYVFCDELGIEVVYML